jgi:hypothetical protein
MFALTGWWELCGGHVTLGSIIALVMACTYHENHQHVSTTALVLRHLPARRIAPGSESRWTTADHEKQKLDPV